jgi:hypothetical protein
MKLPNNLEQEDQELRANQDSREFKMEKVEEVK